MRIQLENGKEIEIPDGLSEAEIDSIADEALADTSNSAPQKEMTKEDFSKFISQNPMPSATSFKKEDVKKIDPLAGEDFNNPVMAAVMNFADSASAGIGPRGASFLQALLDKSNGKGDSVIEGGSQGISDLYNENISGVKNELNRYHKESPIASIFGDIGGLVAPGGVFSTAFKGASKIPTIAKLIGSSEVLPQLAGAGLSGGISNAIYGQAAEDFDAPAMERGEDFAKDFAVGGTLNAGTLGLAKLLKGAGRGAGSVGGVLKKGATALAKKIPGVGGMVEAFETGRFVNGVDDFAKTHGVQDKGVAGREFSEGVGKIKEKALKNYSEFTGQMLNRYGNQPVSAEKLRQGIMRELESIGAVDSKGNIVGNSIIETFDPEMKQVVSGLTNFSDQLTQNPSLADLDRIVKGIGKLAKFDSNNRGVREHVFGSLYNDARESFLGGVDDVVTRSGENAPAYKDATRQSKEVINKIALLDEEAAQPLKGEKVLENISQSRAEKSGELENLKGLLDELDAGNSEKGEAAKNVIRYLRKNISKNLAISDGPIGKLADQLPEEVISKAKSTGKLNLGTQIDEAISTNPEYRGVIKKVILADITSSAKDPRALNKIVGLYKDVLPKVLDAKELQQIQKMAGISTPGQSFISKLLGKVGGGSVNPGAVEILPRTPGPLGNLLNTRNAD